MYYNTFLDNYGDAYVACHNGYQIVLGAAEIRVLDLCRKVVYAAPNLIIHYIIDHKYLPPKEFVEELSNMGLAMNPDELEVLLNLPKGTLFTKNESLNRIVSLKEKDKSF